MRDEMALLRCVVCGRVTSVVEAQLRHFQAGRCADCNGALMLIPPLKETIRADV